MIYGLARNRTLNTLRGKNLVSIAFWVGCRSALSKRGTYSYFDQVPTSIHFSTSPRACVVRQRRPVVMRYFSSAGGDSKNTEDDDDDDEEEEEEENLWINEPTKLEDLKFKDYDIKYLRGLEEEGQLQLQPFYQRGFKWTQKQASAWIESIVYGYPCIPHIILLSTIDEDGEEKYAVFDGQQRLTSTMLYIKNQRAKTWRNRKFDDSFSLDKLPKLKAFEGMTFKDLPKKQQNEILKFEVKCAVIPASWSMENYIDFFKRIQGGGTPMTDQELRRALSQGPFTDLLDNLSNDEIVKKALYGCKGLKYDDVQQLLLRYFQYHVDSKKFGKPSLAQNGLETMKLLNREMSGWTGDAFYKQEDLVNPLKKSLELIIHVFDKCEAFRRPVPLVKEGEVVALDKIKKVWIDQSKIRDTIWDCTVAAFSHEDILRKEKSVLRSADDIRIALITLMQTHPDFTERLVSTEIRKRVKLLKDEILSIVAEHPDDSNSMPPTVRVKIPHQQRKELIRAAVASNSSCPLCGNSLGPYEDHLHIDHIHPVSKGGTNSLNNLQVVHKTCNLMKSNKIIVNRDNHQGDDEGLIGRFWRKTK